MAYVSTMAWARSFHSSLKLSMICSQWPVPLECAPGTEPTLYSKPCSAARLTPGSPPKTCSMWDRSRPETIMTKLRGSWHSSSRQWWVACGRLRCAYCSVATEGTRGRSSLGTRVPPQSTKMARRTVLRYAASTSVTSRARMAPMPTHRKPASPKPMAIGCSSPLWLRAPTVLRSTKKRSAHEAVVLDTTKMRSRCWRAMRSASLMVSARSMAAMRSSVDHTLTRSAPLSTCAHEQNSESTTTPAWSPERAYTYSSGYVLTPSRMAEKMATLSMAHTAMRCAMLTVGTSTSTTLPGATRFTRSAMRRSSARTASESSPRAGRKLRAPTSTCTKATRPFHSGCISSSCSKARSLSVMPRRRSHSSMPPSSTRDPSRAAARRSSPKPGGTPAASTGRR
mmetsp:Transcript_2742/g.7858  ORF Transcript_2742/g.7858 Transcript_2742/m.7858 type:complete len:396 (+) Transcript_2742:990-2177(+)